MGEISERAAVRRLNDRLGFGPVAGGLDDGFEAALARLLTPSSSPVVPPPGLTPPEPRGKTKDAAAKKAANKLRAAQELRLVSWWLDRMVTEPTATERLTWFWHGHFATSNQKVRNAQLMSTQNQTFRTHALGRFGDLARAMVVDPAMIRWLDGAANRKGSPNENLGREFLELFTLGIGHYAEVDVFEGARCLTGWTIRRGSTQARFVPARHDADPKTLFGTTGPYDARGFADLAVAQPASTPFVVGRAGTLVDDLLDLARIDAGLELRLQAVSLKSLALAQAQRLRLAAPGLSVEVGGDDLRLEADPERVAQILTNLANNARTAAGDDGELQILVRNRPPYAEIVVQDNGPGVAPVDRERIFRRLVHSHTTRGSGLGLPIARGFARAHGGDLRCIDRPDGRPGAAFRLLLPLGPI